jgi:hypothetical protein
MGQPDALIAYVEQEYLFANSLMDRIVSAALEPAIRWPAPGRYR